MGQPHLHLLSSLSVCSLQRGGPKGWSKARVFAVQEVWTWTLEALGTGGGRETGRIRLGESGRTAGWHRLGEQEARIVNNQECRDLNKQSGKSELIKLTAIFHLLSRRPSTAGSYCPPNAVPPWIEQQTWLVHFWRMRKFTKPPGCQLTSFLLGFLSV